MSLTLLIFSSDKKLREFSAKRKSSVFPEGSISSSIFSGFEISVNSFDMEKFQSKGKLESMVLKRSRGSTHIILMIDQDQVHWASNITTSAMVIGIDSSTSNDNYQNYFYSKLSKAIKTFNFLNTMFSNLSDSVLLSLPLRNFSGSDLEAIKSQFESQDSISDIQSSFDREMKNLRARVRPRKKSNYKDKYAVDDRERFFVFGKEEHSLPDTGGEHSPYCEFNSHFRFGFKINQKRHYNVSEGEKDQTTISGNFIDCHGTVKYESGKTHLNMFSNDFF